MSPLPQPLTVSTATNTSALAITDSQGHNLSQYIAGDFSAGYGYAVLPTTLAANLSISAQPIEGQIAQLSRYELLPGVIDQSSAPLTSWSQSNIPPQNQPFTSSNDVSNTTILKAPFNPPKLTHFWLDLQILALPEMANIDMVQRQYLQHRYHPKKHRPKPYPGCYRWLLIALSALVGLGWLVVRRGRTIGPT